VTDSYLSQPPKIVSVAESLQNRQDSHLSKILNSGEGTGAGKEKREGGRRMRMRRWERTEGEDRSEGTRRKGRRRGDSEGRNRERMEERGKEWTEK